MGSTVDFHISGSGAVAGPRGGLRENAWMDLPCALKAPTHVDPSRSTRTDPSLTRDARFSQSIKHTHRPRDATHIDHATHAPNLAPRRLETRLASPGCPVCARAC